MFRYRRYRVFVAFALFSLFLVYTFRGARTWPPGTDVDAPAPAPAPANRPAAEQKEELATPATPERPSQKSPPPGHPAPKTFPTPGPRPGSQFEPGARPKQPAAANPAPIDIHAGDYPHGTGGEGRVEVQELPAELPVIHWEKQKEHYPVKTTIQLPKGRPTAIPKIQFDFKRETPTDKAAREEKLATIKASAKHAWGGYRKIAFGKDEVSPVSGTYRNPFNGWGATLVDSLDTLWIMGMKEEFEEAVDKVTEIDFTTSARNDIPVFETTIRYLGGLLAAYDVSNAKYNVLLDKAVQLAEILMGCFDTPNRMPMTFYQWKPAFATQSHKAGTNVVLAEIGSLSMEFTRLAQITKEPRYYDAIARITDEFETWQKNTRLAGMWPDTVDASGCEDPIPPPGGPAEFTETGAADGQTYLGEGDAEMVPLKRPAPHFDLADGTKPIDVPLVLPKPLVFSSEADPLPADVPLVKPKPLTFSSESGPGPIDVPLVKPKPLTFSSERESKLKRREETSPTKTTKVLHLQRRGSAAEMAQVIGAGRDSQSHNLGTPVQPDQPTCTASGLASTSEYGMEKYTLGGQADSMYEYLPKMYLLLGGLEPKYRPLYEKAADTAIDKLVFRPMTPQNHDILIAGSYLVPGKSPSIDEKLVPEGSHLTCFVGGMFALGAKIFNRKEDLNVASKLTDGCAWAYNSTVTGIMPEGFMAIPCESKKHCEWNETAWYDALDPYYENRMESYRRQMEQISKEAELASVLKAKATQHPAFRDTEDYPAPAAALPTADSENLYGQPFRAVEKRQLNHSPQPPVEEPPRTQRWSDAEDSSIKRPTSSVVDPESSEAPDDQEDYVYVPPPPPSHEEYVKTKIEDERLPIGMTMIGYKKYILRPEAIESVFYMHRITGDPHWRQVGWKMFQAIEQHTRTQYGHSAIMDVTSSAPTQDDSMESFWIAETLKYFYLLFADETVISLDDWVLNTEAHPFKRPKA